MDGSLASTQQPHQLPASVGAITRDSTSSAPPQRVSDHPTEVQPEESSPKPELELSSNEVQTTADILQVLQRLQAQQSVPPTPQTASFTPKPEPQPQPQPQSQPPPVSVLPKEESQPTTAVVPGEPVSEWDALRTSLRESPHDTEGWNKLVRLAEDSGDLEKIKEAYECLLKMYPNTVRNLQSVVKHVLTRLRPVVCSNSLSQSFPRAGPF
jgi:cleavage stimulation factor subunit 3